MTNTQIAALIAELMEKYDARRRQWIETFGSEDGFDQWFTTQVLEAAK